MPKAVLTNKIAAIHVMIAVIYVIYIQVLDTGIAWKKSLAFRLFKNPKRFAVMWYIERI